MINRDYILRMIEQLSRFLAKVLLMRDGKEYLAAINEVKTAGKMFLGLNPEAMDALTDRDLIQLWSVGKDLDAEKCALAAQIFKAEGEIYESQGDFDKASDAYIKSFSLLTETINFLKEKIPGELIATVEFLTHHLDTSTIPFSLRRNLFITYATIGRFSKAEDLLFDMIQENASFSEEGKRFYHQLLKRTDEDLEKGDLPRSEVIQGLAELDRRI